MVAIAPVVPVASNTPVVGLMVPAPAGRVEELHKPPVTTSDNVSSEPAQSEPPVLLVMAAGEVLTVTV